jgi:hypothetical protein
MPASLNSPCLIQCDNHMLCVKNTNLYQDIVADYPVYIPVSWISLGKISLGEETTQDMYLIYFLFQT